MLESRVDFLSQRASISEVSTRFNSIGTYPPIPLLQPDDQEQLRERGEILVAFSIFNVSSGQTQKIVYQCYPDFTIVCLRESKIKLKAGLTRQIFFLCLREDKILRRKKSFWRD